MVEEVSKGCEAACKAVGCLILSGRAFSCQQSITYDKGRDEVMSIISRHGNTNGAPSWNRHLSRAGSPVRGSLNSSKTAPVLHQGTCIALDPSVASAHCHAPRQRRLRGSPVHLLPV